MFSHRKVKSLESPPVSATPEEDTQEQPMQKSCSYGHRRQTSGIPRPSGEAPLFRNDAVDRFYSRIPYPKTGGNLFYDILTGEEKWRNGKHREKTPRGGLSNLFTRRAKVIDSKPARESPKKLGGISVSPNGVNPAISEDGSPTSRSSPYDFHQYPQTPRFSEISRSSTPKASDASFSSQSTVLEYGSEVTDLMDFWGSRTPLRRDSVSNSELSFDMASMDEERGSKRETAKLKPLPRSILKDCLAGQDGHGKKWHLDISRTPCVSEACSPDPVRKKSRARDAVSPASTTSSNRTIFYRLGRLRRRPQVPVSEASDIDSCREASELSFSGSVSERSKKRSLKKTVSNLFSIERTSTPFPPSEAREKSNAYAVKSTASRRRFEKGEASGLEPYEWVQRHSFDCYKDSASKEAANRKLSSRNEGRRNRVAEWLSVTLDVSLKALVLISGAAFAHYVLDSPKESHQDETTSKKEDIQEFDLDAHSLSFSSCTLDPSGAMAHSYPITLLDSLSDMDV